MKDEMLKINQKAPDFCLSDQNGKEVCLDGFKGKWIVLYFYPKDSTPGCTMEAKDFTRLKDDFEKSNAAVIGISKDGIISHQKFMETKKLRHTLLSDPDSKVQKKYNVWRMKRFMGREYLGTVRSTYLIDPQMKIAKIWDNVRAKGHADQVFKELMGMI